MTVTVVVPHFGDPKLTYQCVKAVEAHSPPVELVIVDQSANLNPIMEATVIVPPTNLGFAAGCNLGARIASGDVLVFLNNDCLPHPGWLHPLVDVVKAGGGIAGSKLVYPDGRIQHAGVAVDFSRPPGTEAWNLLDDWTAHPQPVQAVTGACLAVDRHLFARVDGFNEAYWNGYEDIDLCLAAARKGAPVTYVPASVVTHLESQSGEERWRCVAENIQRLRATWGNA